MTKEERDARLLELLYVIARRRDVKLALQAAESVVRNGMMWPDGAVAPNAIAAAAAAAAAALGYIYAADAELHADIAELEAMRFDAEPEPGAGFTPVLDAFRAIAERGARLGGGSVGTP